MVLKFVFSKDTFKKYIPTGKASNELTIFELPVSTIFDSETNTLPVKSVISYNNSPFQEHKNQIQCLNLQD